jgi:excisionase family DNA binding protein
LTPVVVSSTIPEPAKVVRSLIQGRRANGRKGSAGIGPSHHACGVGGFCLFLPQPPLAPLSAPLDEDTRMNGHIVEFKKVPDKRLLSSSRAARYIGVGASTIRDMTARGEIPSYDLHGRRGYKLEDLDRYIDSLKPWQEHKKQQ